MVKTVWSVMRITVLFSLYVLATLALRAHAPIGLGVLAPLSLHLPQLRGWPVRGPKGPSWS